MIELYTRVNGVLTPVADINAAEVQASLRSLVAAPIVDEYDATNHYDDEDDDDYYPGDDDYYPDLCGRDTWHPESERPFDYEERYNRSCKREVETREPDAIWVTGSGQRIPVEYMTSEHARNALRVALSIAGTNVYDLISDRSIKDLLRVIIRNRPRR
jgi:hypothetical protein